MNERRKHRRFQVENGTFAVLGGRSWSHSTQTLGQITDIGMGALAFSYIASEEVSDDSVELNIFLSEN